MALKTGQAEWIAFEFDEDGGASASCQYTTRQRPDDEPSSGPTLCANDSGSVRSYEGERFLIAKIGKR